MRVMIDNWQEYARYAEETTGKQSKLWLVKDNKLWLFKERGKRKEDGSPILNDVCECIASDIISLLDVACAKYFLCTRNGVKGVVTPDFKNNMPYTIKREEFISGVHLIYKIDAGFKNTWLENPNTKQLYTLSLVLESVKEYGFIKEALEMVIVSLLIGNTDCNPSNYGVIKSLDTKQVRFAPIYDNGSALAMAINDKRIHRDVIEVDGKPYVVNAAHFKEVIHNHVISKIVLEKHFQRQGQKLWYKKRQEQGLPNIAYNFRIMEYQPMIEYMTTFYPDEISNIMNNIAHNITPENIDIILSKYDGEMDVSRKKFAREIVLERAKWMTNYYNQEIYNNNRRAVL